MSVIRAVCEPLLIVYEHCIFPDARRVAPIRACVLCLRFLQRVSDNLFTIVVQLA